MGKKRKHVETVAEIHKEEEQVDEERPKYDNETHSGPTFRNKEKVLVTCSRRINYRYRHLMLNLVSLLPHCKKENKVESKAALNELVDLKSCSSCLFFESRKETDLYLWMTKCPTGPSVKFLVNAVHTMEELKLAGNHLNNSRPLLTFSTSFGKDAHWKLLKEMITQVFRDIDDYKDCAEIEIEENVHAGIFAENEIGDGDDFRTPNETIRGVQKTLNFSKEDEVSDSIMSVAREVQSTHDESDSTQDASDNITEKEMLSRVQEDFDELEKLKIICRNSLKKARALFPKNKEFIEYTHNLNNMDPFSSTTVERETEFGENKLRREQKVGEFHKSPFLNRTIDLNRQRLTKEEEELWKWINGTRQGAMNEIFFWNGTTCYKHHIQSLQLDKRIVFNVVDVYTCILNDNEKYRSSNSPRRFFCNTLATMGNVVGGDRTDNSLNFMKFRSNLDSLLHKNKVNICNVELIFFPIYYSNHFYVVCFNLKNIGAVLIDNKLRGGDDISIYNGIPEFLREMFAEYMAYVNLRRSKMLRSVPIVRLQMKWRTDNNILDAGVFVMNHMETYMGTALRYWDCKFVAEEHEQKKQLERARKIYAAMIIYSPINYYKDKCCKTSRMSVVYEETVEPFPGVLM